MHRIIRHPLTVWLGMLAFGTSACSVDTSDSPNRNGDFEGVDVTAMPLLAAGCSITGTVMTVTVKDGESVLVALRTTDSVVTVNGHIFAGTGTPTDTGNPCEIASTGTMVIQADTTGATHTLGRSIILDYINGLYMLGTATLPGIKIDLTLTGDTGSLNWLKVRGSDGVDLFAIGGGTVATFNTLNVNAKTTATSAATQVGGTGGATVTLDNLGDVNFKLVGNVMMSVGLGDDRIDGTTGLGVGTAYAAPLQLFGGDGNDTLIGGTANDTINGGLLADTMSGCAGNDTYDMGTAAAGADIITQICPVTPALTNEGTDTVDYHSRTNAVTVNLSHTLTNTTPAMDAGGVSGEASGDGAHISDKIVNITLGAGDDAIVIGSMSTLIHKVLGGPGDDSFTGGLAADLFDGQAGDDTCIGGGSIMDYHLRTTPLNVSICNGSPTACGTTAATDANDGELAVTRTGTGAATVAPGGAGANLVTITGTGFSAASLGNTLTLSACADASAVAIAGENGPYKIVRYVDSTHVKIDVLTNANFTATTDVCSYSEAKADGTTNPSTGVTASTMTAKRTGGTVTGLNHATNWGLGDTLTLTHSTGAATDDGAYPVIKSLGATSVAIDDSVVGTFAGGISAMGWSDLGPEHDNVQCTQVLGGTGADVIAGDNRPNILHGGDGADTLSGNAGNDAVYGEAGADTLYGGAGDDTLVGGGGTTVTADGADQLIGGDGNDILEGDDAADMFQCNGKNKASDSAVGTAPGESDITVDFTPSTDTGPAGSATLTDCRF
jgi:Ca2+-binding RTX toxin-like protein